LGMLVARSVSRGREKRGASLCGKSYIFNFVIELFGTRRVKILGFE
jgi:hypothetical protein